MGIVVGCFARLIAGQGVNVVLREGKSLQTEQRCEHNRGEREIATEWALHPGNLLFMRSLRLLDQGRCTTVLVAGIN